MNKEDQKTYKFHVEGMHCASCVIVTESKLKDASCVMDAKSHLATCTVDVTGRFGHKTKEEVAEELSEVLKDHGYKLSVEQKLKPVKWGEFKVALPVAIVIVVLFVFLQKLGIVNMVNAGSVNYGTAFLVGVVASLSTCMAVVGGLVLSISATFAKEQDKIRPQVLFHFGRIVSFFLLGGIVGLLGSAFQLGINGTFVLGLVVGVVMLIMGINLLDIFHFTKRLQPTMPKFLSRHAIGISKFNHTLTPALVGVATFFLPCGFTQSMQIYTLSTGSFLVGGLTMLSFALGTLPVLALISFSSLAVRDKMNSGVFFKTAGIVVIFFALFNIVNSLVVTGLIPPAFNF
jgi:sulfite exporter TauE/SafE/copper chaperone CopZ